VYGGDPEDDIIGVMQRIEPMAEYFWTAENGIHECWLLDEDKTLRSYQRVGECRRDREEGGFKAARYRLPVVFPEVHHFGSVTEARGWIVEVLGR
jgi:hypothetical protein